MCVYGKCSLPNARASAFPDSSSRLWLMPRIEERVAVQYSAQPSALYLLLGTDVTVVSTFALAAVCRLRGQPGVTLTADHLFALELAGKSGERGLNLDGTETTSTETKYEMEGGLLLDVVVLESAAVLKLFSGEDQSLLIRWDSFFVLDLGPERLQKEAR